MANFDHSRSRTVIWRLTEDDLSFEHARLSRNGGMPEISGSIMIAEQGVPGPEANLTKIFEAEG